jgi:predicted metal-dependent phosphoesterase TrpH
MYKRLELHNHTTESDGNLKPLELIKHMYTNKVDAFAITDHNTISGHKKIKKLLEDLQFPISHIMGMEYTTYYGHILCLNLKEYIPWENINLNHPELLFQSVKEKGALAGIAHPFSYGHPFSRGCRFDMEITDFNSFDFIEIFNNSQPLHAVNKRGLHWWEELVLQGYSGQ